MSASLEEYMNRVLGQSFTHYIGKETQLQQRTNKQRLAEMGVPLRVRPKAPEKPVAPPVPEKVVKAPHPAGKYAFKRVLAIACAVYGVREDEVLSGSRNTKLVKVRQQIVRVLREKRGLSTLEIGKRLNRDHSTVIHAYNCACANAEQSRHEYEQITTLLESY